MENEVDLAGRRKIYMQENRGSVDVDPEDLEKEAGREVQGAVERVCPLRRV